MKSIVISVIIFLGLSVSALDDHWICENAAIYSFSPMAIQSEWNGSTWQARLNDGTLTYWTGNESVYELGIMDTHQDGPAYIDFYDTDTELMWRFAFIDLEESDGGGHHHICSQGPVVFQFTHKEK